jgi:hypothetical protein
MPVFADTPNRSRYSKDIKAPPRTVWNTSGGRGTNTGPYGTNVTPTRTSADLGIDLGSTEETADEQFVRIVTESGGDAFINDAGVVGMGTPEDVIASNEVSSKPEPEAAKPEKPKPKPIKTKPTPSKMISSAGWIADLMAQMGFAPEETAEINTSRYPRQEAAVPELGLRGQPDDQWMGLLSALLEEKKRREARSLV